MSRPGDLLSIGRLIRTPEGALSVRGPVLLPEYSRFKYGDGALAAQYGEVLARLWLKDVRDSRPVLITGSGYNRLAPAAHAMLPALAGTLRSVGLAVTRFTVHRENTTDGDYAQMSAADRREALGEGALSCPDIDLSGSGHRVLAVDDVRVTGTHERAMDKCLREAGAQRVEHLYVLDASDVQDDPHAEAIINASAVSGVSDLIALTASESFVPNARFAKAVVLLSRKDRAQFLTCASPEAIRWFRHAALHGGLGEVPAYRAGILDALDQFSRVPGVAA